MKGILKAITGKTYGLYDGKDECIFTFDVLDNKKRVKIDPLQGQEVDYDKDLKSLVGKEGKVVEAEEAKKEEEKEEKEE